MAQNKGGNAISLAIEVIFIGTILVAALGLLWGATEFTPTVGEQINTGTYPATIVLAHQDLISGSVVVRNSTWNPVITTNNYSINLVTGVITTTSPSNLTNNTIFLVDYNSGAWDSISILLLKTVLSIVITITAILMILTRIGYKVEF